MSTCISTDRSPENEIGERSVTSRTSVEVVDSDSLEKIETIFKEAQTTKENTIRRFITRHPRIIAITLLITLLISVICIVIVCIPSTANVPGTIRQDKWPECSECHLTGKQYSIKKIKNKLFQMRECTCSEAKDVMFEIRFNRSSLYTNWFMSENNKVISNRYTHETPNSGRGVQRFQNYRGVLTDQCVQDNTIIYYSVGYQYKITSTLTGSWLVLELGIAERDKIDDHHYVGSTEVSGWSFHLYNCQTHNKICVNAEHKGFDYHESVFSDNTVGTTKQGSFDVMVDRIKNTFTLIENKKVVYTLHGVTSDVELCPVFGVHNAHRVEAKLYIINSYNLTNLNPLYE